MNEPTLNGIELVRKIKDLKHLIDVDVIAFFSPNDMTLLAPRIKVSSSVGLVSFFFAGLWMFTKMSAIKLKKPMLVSRKMRRNPVEKISKFGGENKRSLLEILRGTVPAGEVYQLKMKAVKTRINAGVTTIDRRSFLQLHFLLKLGHGLQCSAKCSSA